MRVTKGDAVTWTDCEGRHVGTVDEVWEGEQVAVVVGREGPFDSTWFVPVAVLGAATAPK